MNGNFWLVNRLAGLAVNETGHVFSLFGFHKCSLLVLLSFQLFLSFFFFFFFFFFWSVSFARFSLFTQSLKDCFLLYICTHGLTHSYRISIILCNLLTPKSAFPGLTSLLCYSRFLPWIVSEVLTGIPNYGHFCAYFYFILVLLRAGTENCSRLFRKHATTGEDLKELGAGWSFCL